MAPASPPPCGCCWDACGPNAGRALVTGQDYRDLTSRRRPSVGALLDAGGGHPGRSAHAHLHALARSNRLPCTRVTEVLDQVGLSSVARQRVGGYSLGMRQRLGIAAALLGDPGVIVLDEPFNGLDTEGIRWLRGLVRALAADGRTVLAASHLISEIEQIADQLVILGRGRLLLEASPDECRRAHAGSGLLPGGNDDHPARRSVRGCGVPGVRRISRRPTSLSRRRRSSSEPWHDAPD